MKTLFIFLAILKENNYVVSQELQIARHRSPLISKMDSKSRSINLYFLHYNADQKLQLNLRILFPHLSVETNQHY